MARKKYIRDYRLVETIDESGQIRSDYEYIGDDYVYALGADAVRREKRRALLLTAVSALALIGGLTPNAAAMRAVYVVLPYLLSAIPLGLILDTLLTCAPDAEPLQHKQADMLENRLPPAALFAFVLPGAALLGTAIRGLTAGDLGGSDIPFVLCAALMTAAGLCVFARRERFACHKK